MELDPVTVVVQGGWQTEILQDVKVNVFIKQIGQKHEGNTG